MISFSSDSARWYPVWVANLLFKSYYLVPSVGPAMSQMQIITRTFSQLRKQGLIELPEAIPPVSRQG